MLTKKAAKKQKPYRGLPPKGASATSKSGYLKVRATRQGKAGGTTYARYQSSKSRHLDVVKVRQHLGVTQVEMRCLTGYAPRTIAGWESGKKVSASAGQKYVELDRLREALGGIIEDAAVPDWLRKPNPAFEGQTPMRVIERGESDRIWRMIYEIDAGVAS